MLQLIKITDNGGETMDRYTAYFEGDGDIDGDYMLSMSEAALSPQGVCLSNTCKQEYMANDTGLEVNIVDLPDQVQTAIYNFME